MNFEPISLNREADYTKRFERCSQVASDYTFVNLWGWADEYDLSWAWDDQFVWIRQGGTNPCYWAPVGEWSGVDWLACLKIFKGENKFIRVPEKLANIWRKELDGYCSVMESREHWDYLYSSRELIELAGNRFHSKKNLFSQFRSKYNYQYVAMEKSMVAKTLSMQEDWCVWKNCEASAGLIAENIVIERILQEWDNFEKIVGGIILIEGDVAAFTVGELVRPDTMVIHFEKGLGKYKGIYQAINKLFLEANPNAHVVNREQDLGNLGLRKSKLSYNPTSFVEKFTVDLILASS